MANSFTAAQDYIARFLYSVDSQCPGASLTPGSPFPGPANLGKQRTGSLPYIEAGSVILNEGVRRGFISADGGTTPAVNPPTDADFQAVGSLMTAATFASLTNNMILVLTPNLVSDLYKVRG